MTQPTRALGLVGATSLVVGSVIGSGIFLTPATVAGHVPGGGLVLLVWIVGGVLSLMAALTLAELGGMMPRAGGQYVFLREAYGNGAGFLFGWMALAVNYSGTIAAVAVACALYLGAVLGFAGFAAKLVAIGLIWLLTLVNMAGIRAGGGVQASSTAAKLLALTLLLPLGLLLGSGPDPPLGEIVGGTDPGLVASFGLALVAALFAFDGLQSATFVAGEVRDAQRTVPRATLLGALIVTLVYLSVNLAFLMVLPVARLADNERAAFDIGQVLGGPTGATLMACLVVLSTFGTLNGYVLQSPRIYYAMAQDGMLYRSFAKLDPRRGTPLFGLIIQAEWCSLLVLSGTFDQLITYVVISSWIFLGLTGLAVFRLRRTRPDAARPYRVWGYPFVPILFVASAALIVANSLVFDTRNALVGLALALSGVPVYWFVRRRTAAPATTDS